MRPPAPGERYRITVMGPGVTPVIQWEGAGPDRRRPCLGRVGHGRVRPDHGRRPQALRPERAPERGVVRRTAASARRAGPCPRRPSSRRRVARRATSGDVVGTSTTASRRSRPPRRVPASGRGEAGVGRDDLAAVVVAGAQRHDRPLAVGRRRRLASPCGSARKHDRLGAGHERRRAALLDVREPDEPRHPRVGRRRPEPFGRRDLHDRPRPASPRRGCRPRTPPRRRASRRAAVCPISSKRSRSSATSRSCSGRSSAPSGSSSRSTRGAGASARARATRLRSPPESEAIARRSRPPSPTRREQLGDPRRGDGTRRLPASAGRRRRSRRRRGAGTGRRPGT